MIILSTPTGWSATTCAQVRSHEAWAYGLASGPDLLEVVATATANLAQELARLAAEPVYVPPVVPTGPQNLLEILGLDQPPAVTRTIRRV